MNILFIGDIVGSMGREAVKQLLPKLQKKYIPALTIANVENLAHGKGVTEVTLAEMREAGVDCFTSGNHIFAKKGHEILLGDATYRLIRPANYPPRTPGVGEMVIPLPTRKTSQKNILLVNLMGRVFFREHLDCPFRTFDSIMESYQGRDDIVATIVDLHAEATSEKNAFRFYADGRATAILGTHTHISTADEHISERGSAYITDVGATMARESVLGVDKEIIIHNFLSQLPVAHELPTTGVADLHGVVVTIDPDKKVATKIQRVWETTTIG